MPHTLNEALAATYSNQPALQAERAKLRATDENVPTALAGWRPTVRAGRHRRLWRRHQPGLQLRDRRTTLTAPTDRLIGTAQATVTQTLYNGGKTQANINRAKNQVMAERATLDRAGADQLHQCGERLCRRDPGAATARSADRNNEIVLAKQLAGHQRPVPGRRNHPHRRGTGRGGAGGCAGATRETSEGQLETARGTFQQIIGVLPPADLVQPQPLDAAGEERDGGDRHGGDQQSAA